MTPRPIRPRDPDKRYLVDLCMHCGHPGGMHMLGQWRDGEWVDLHGACKCGKCPGWDEEHVQRGYWTDRQSRELEAALAAVHAACAGVPETEPGSTNE